MKLLHKFLGLFGIVILFLIDSSVASAQSHFDVTRLMNSSITEQYYLNQTDFLELRHRNRDDRNFYFGDIRHGMIANSVIFGRSGNLCANIFGIPRSSGITIDIVQSQLRNTFGEPDIDINDLELTSAFGIEEEVRGLSEESRAFLENRRVNLVAWHIDQRAALIMDLWAVETIIGSTFEYSISNFNSILEQSADTSESNDNRRDIVILLSPGNWADAEDPRMSIVFFDRNCS